MDIHNIAELPGSDHGDLPEDENPERLSQPDATAPDVGETGRCASSREDEVQSTEPGSAGPQSTQSQSTQRDGQGTTHDSGGNEAGHVGGPRRVVPGSEREPLAAGGGLVPAAQSVTVTVVLRRRQPLHPQVLRSGALTSPQLAASYGADPRDVAAVEAAVAQAGCRVVEALPAARTLRVEGSVEALSDLFGTQLHTPQDGPAGQTRMRSGALSVPASLDGVVVAVLGLDDRPAAATRHVVAEAAAVTHSYTPPQLADLYGLPAGDGTGQTIAILELGGGYEQSDLDTYFTGLGLPVPTVTAVGVDGATNVPGKDPQGADGEVMLDIEVAGGIAPAAHQLVYFAPNTDAGFLDAVNQAIHATPAPVAISISWGQSEDQWTAQARTAMDAAFADAAALGVTVTCAAGDNGSSDNDTSGTGIHCDFPAASPHVLACGGTTLTTSTTNSGPATSSQVPHRTTHKGKTSAPGGSSTTTTETVWGGITGDGATGGGYSDTFTLPDWQHGIVTPPTNTTGSGTAGSGAAGSGRGVPDVAADADPRTGYQVRVDGTDMVIGGTSAVAPLWAGLIARIAHATGQRYGLINPLLYTGATASTTAPGFRDITTGSNGHWTATTGWDPCTGLGSPTTAITTNLQTNTTP